VSFVVLFAFAMAFAGEGVAGSRSHCYPPEPGTVIPTSPLYCMLATESMRHSTVLKRHSTLLRNESVGVDMCLELRDFMSVRVQVSSDACLLFVYFFILCTYPNRTRTVVFHLVFTFNHLIGIAAVNYKGVLVGEGATLTDSGRAVQGENNHWVVQGKNNHFTRRHLPFFFFLSF
jgi:hypothetical protein